MLPVDPRAATDVFDPLDLDANERAVLAVLEQEAVVAPTREDVVDEVEVVAHDRLAIAAARNERHQTTFRLMRPFVIVLRSTKLRSSGSAVVGNRGIVEVQSTSHRA